MTIARFESLGSAAEPSSETVIWEDPEPWQHMWHHGGGLSFGPDGYLYLSTGDQVESLQAQDLTNARGKVIRIGSDGSIPPDNPFVDGPGGNLDEIWAYGLRNPYRSRWDIPLTGPVPPRLFIGEVGGNVQSQATEDIHIGASGANFGWPFCEGDCSDPQYSDPIFYYPHSGSGASVTGGVVYRGGQFQPSQEGAYFYGDYVRGWIRYLTFDGSGNFLSDNEFETSAGLVVEIKVGPDGALYYTEIASDYGFTPNSGSHPSHRLQRRQSVAGDHRRDRQSDIRVRATGRLFHRDCNRSGRRSHRLPLDLRRRRRGPVQGHEPSLSRER